MTTTNNTPAKCPTAPDCGDLTGCGGTNVTEPDSEGFRDCLDCGLFFKPCDHAHATQEPK